MTLCSPNASLPDERDAISLTCLPRAAYAALASLLSLVPPAAGAELPTLAPTPLLREPSTVPDEAVPSPEYSKLVKRYAAGEHGDAVALVGSWDANRLRLDLEALRDAAAKASKCTGCPEKLVFLRFSVRAALMLHADREVLEELRPPVSEQPPQCGTGGNARVVERLTTLLVLVDPEPGDFLRRFYLGMARQAHWSHCLAQAQQWARAGLKWFPRDAPLLFTLGIASETNAFHMRAPAPRRAGLTTRAMAEHESLLAGLRDLWEVARRTFEEAVAADPDLHEARLRLGRVLWRLKKPEPARVCFETALAQSGDRSLQYLARLFLGRIHEDRGQLAEAEKEYRAALAMRPASEPAAVAVSHVRQLQGDSESAREILNRSLEYARRRIELDPWLQYDMAHSAEGAPLLERLRLELRP